MAQSQRKLRYDPGKPEGQIKADNTLETAPLFELPRQSADDEIVVLADENPRWTQTTFVSGVALSILGTLVYFAGVWTTILILLGIIAFLAACIDGTIDA